MITKPTIILTFDTSMGACSAGLFSTEKNELLISKYEEMNRGQAERLMPMIDEIIEESGFSYKDLGLISCTHGPGAFTGLRLSLATAKTLSLSLNIPCVGVSTLEAVFRSYQASGQQNILVCLETKRKDFYSQIFDTDGNALCNAKSRKLKDIEALITEFSPVIIGDVNQRLMNETALEGIKTQDILFANCHSIAVTALQNYEEGTGRLQKMSPLYLREADVSFPATKK